MGEADVADEMRVGRAGGDDGGDEDIPVERLYVHEEAVRDRRDRSDQHQELSEAVESVGLGGHGGVLLLGRHGEPLLAAMYNALLLARREGRAADAESGGEGR